MKTVNTMKLNKIMLLLVLLSAAFTISAEPDAQAKHDENKSTFSVMTQNLDAGTDFKYFFDSTSNNDQSQADILVLATKTYGEVLKSQIPKRMARLAELIAQAKPDLISLQEVTLWDSVSSSGGKAVLYDQLELLLRALKKLDHPYRVLVKQSLSQGQLPVDPSIIGRPNDTTREVGFTDSDVILASAELKRTEVAFSNPEKHIYSTILPFPLLSSGSVRGWISIDINKGGKKLRLVNTHLETVIPSIPGTAFFQEAQATELVEAQAKFNEPIVIAGDFNADAEFAKIGPDQTETPNIMVNAGYTDTWDEKHPSQSGFTWPLFIEDPLAPNPVGPFERIDLIYERGLKTVSVKLVDKLHKDFASDHLGVIAKFRISDKSHP